MVEGRGLMLAGGFIRSVIEGSVPKDLDFFGPSKEVLENAAIKLAHAREAKLHYSENAITVITPTRTPVQFITRWMYANPEELVREFDFTICQAVVWWGPFPGTDIQPRWRSICSDDFYADLAAKRLVYTFPQREEAAGGSMLRVRKFLQRGYNIQPASLAGVIARLVKGIEKNTAGLPEYELAEQLSFLLFEVDPLLIIDGMDVIDEHEDINQG
jgi:hypothetical protein